MSLSIYVSSNCLSINHVSSNHICRSPEISLIISSRKYIINNKKNSFLKIIVFYFQETKSGVNIHNIILAPTLNQG